MLIIMKYKILSVCFVVFLTTMFLCNIISNYEAAKEEFAGERLSLSTLKSCILFVKDADASNAPFKKQYIETNGIYHILRDKKYVFDISSDVVKLSNGYLAFADTEKSVLDQEKATEYVTEFNSFAKENETDFLYVCVPSKLSEDNQYAPKGVYPIYGDTSGFLSSIEKNGVNVVDIRKEFEKDNLDQYDFYFKTDHHWTPQGGFYAYQKICNFLQTSCGYKIDKTYTDITQYNVDIYPNYFTGSEGNRTGSIFGGKDDFSLIYPKFDTDLSIDSWDDVKSAKKVSSSGIFYDTVFNLNSFNIGGGHTYSTYLSGDAALKIIKNNISENNKKILIVKDSYGNIPASYLSLICSQVHIIDLRFYTDVNIQNYVKENKIDTVIALYANTALQNLDGMLDFNSEK